MQKITKINFYSKYARNMLTKPFKDVQGLACVKHAITHTNIIAIQIFRTLLPYASPLILHFTEFKKHYCEFFYYFTLATFAG